MLAKSVEWLEAHSATAAADYLHDAVLEAFLVHARLLDDFLGAEKRPYKTDVLATDYVPTWVPQRPLDAEKRDRVNWQVADMSMERDADYVWPTSKMANWDV